MRALYVASFTLLVSSAGAQPGPVDLAAGCRAAIAVEFGRDPRTMSVAPQGPLVALSYVRPDDRTTWRFMCRLGETTASGTRIEWAAVQEGGSLGRWRIDGINDMVVTVRREGNDLVARMDMPSGGNIRIRSFPISALQGRGTR